MEPLLEVRGLKTHFLTEEGLCRSVDGVDFTVGRRHTLGLVGESGCGKSVTALSVMGLVQGPAGRVVAGEILYHRRDGVVDLARQAPRGPVMRSIRGNEIAMIFQEPMTSLNPVYPVGEQIAEAVRLHQRVKAREARGRAVEMLRAVGIPAPEQRAAAYPHQLSGGMRQRAMIAMALSCNPALLIADEPTTALDVTIQAQVLELMAGLRERFQTSMLFITHDLGIVAQIADDVAVMYLGRIVERGPVRAIFARPGHPYTIGLLNSLPDLGDPGHRRLEPIAGTVPSPTQVPPGCVFAPRCPRAMAACREAMPPMLELGGGHGAACWLHGGQGAGVAS